MYLKPIRQGEAFEVLESITGKFSTDFYNLKLYLGHVPRRKLCMLNAEHQAALNKNAQWLKQWKLTLLADKTTTLIFSRKKLNIQNVNLNDQRTERKKFFRYLGIHIDQQLNFDEHTDFLGKRVAKFCGTFNRLRKFLSTKHLVTTYKSFVQPIIQYGVKAYASTKKIF